MKRALIAAVVVALAVPAAAFAQEAVGAWCGGSHGSQGTNFGQCINVDRNARVAGQTSGLTHETMSVPTKPENPSPLVDRSREVQSPGGSD